jgi:hypothetical protein
MGVIKISYYNVFAVSRVALKRERFLGQEVRISQALFIGLNFVPFGKNLPFSDTRAVSGHHPGKRQTIRVNAAPSSGQPGSYRLHWQRQGWQKVPGSGHQAGQ